jgi:iron(III) transport system ATP-binding protein
MVEVETDDNPAGQAPGKGIVVENVSHSFDGVPVLRNMNLTVGPREIVTLLGPSGCGKTTMLRLIAGLEDLQQGRIIAGDRVLADDDVNVPPEERSVSLLFQDFALFPHLTAIENVMFGLHKWPAKDRRGRALHVLDQVGMAKYAKSYPHQLSGGQQQRIALARSRGPRPRIMLLDEPFSSLDTALKRQVRDMVLWVLQNSVSTTLMVTHDPEEAMFMSDRIAVMREGSIVQMGTPDELYTQPVNGFVLSLFGDVNRVEGVVDGGIVRTPLGVFATGSITNGTRVEVFVRSEGLRIDPESAIKGEVVTGRRVGRATLLHLEIPTEGGKTLHVHARLADEVPPAVSERVGLRVEPSHMFVFPLHEAD